MAGEDEMGMRNRSSSSSSLILASYIPLLPEIYEKYHHDKIMAVLSFFLQKETATMKCLRLAVCRCYSSTQKPMTKKSCSGE